jgi:hypothetical protein
VQLSTSDLARSRATPSDPLRAAVQLSKQAGADLPNEREHIRYYLPPGKHIMPRELMHQDSFNWN